MVPWEFSSLFLLNQAGLDIAFAGATNMTESEIGSITVAGFPNNPLASEISAWNNGLYDGTKGSLALIENRDITSRFFSAISFDGSPFSTNFAIFDFGFRWSIL